jgi:hypothetical protein
MELTAVQKSACESLHGALRGSQLKGDENRDSSASEQDWYSYLELGADPLEDSDDEVYEEVESLPYDSKSVDTASDPIAGNPIQVQILNLLVSLYTQLPNSNDDKFFSPILQFAILFSLQKNGQWLPPGRITHIFAVLLFCGREVMMALMHRDLLEHPTLRYSKYVMFSICIKAHF